MASVFNSNSTKPPTQGLQTLVPKSSWITMYEYDPQNLRLTTNLKNGSIYQHTFVMPLEFQALTTSANHAIYFTRNIKGKKLGIKVKVHRSPTAGIQNRRNKA